MHMIPGAVGRCATSSLTKPEPLRTPPNRQSDRAYRRTSRALFQANFQTLTC